MLWLVYHNPEIDWRTENGRIWKAVETKVGEVRMAKAEGRRKKERS